MDLSSQLSNRTLWFDGTSTVPSTDVSTLLRTNGSVIGLHVDQVTPEISTFNKFVPKNKQITVKTEVNIPDIEWVIPEEYKQLDVKQYLLDRLAELPDLAPADLHQRISRVLVEYAEYQARQLVDVLRTIIFVINTLRDTNTVWGVGRGSSVSSYILYLVGVHDVDSVAYDISFDDFMHD